MSGFLWSCECCGAPRLLLLELPRGAICAACWQALGQPSPPPASDVERFAAEQATRERMLEHGGTSRHLVRGGLS